MVGGGFVWLVVALCGWWLWLCVVGGGGFVWLVVVALCGWWWFCVVGGGDFAA